MKGSIYYDKLKQSYTDKHNIFKEERVIMLEKKSDKKYILEVCVDSVESAIEAVKGGADRLELCANLVIGGTTPSPELFNAVRRVTDIPMHVLIRPRFGDFCYTDYEFKIIKEEVKMFRELGAEGVVIGVLTREGELDVSRMETLIKEANGLPVTLHRAFDVCKNPYDALMDAKKLGIDTILTSGQKNHCLDGRELLKDLVEKAGKDINIMIGSGVTPEVISEMAPYTKALAFHMSGKENIESLMTYRNADVSMGLPIMSEYMIWRTNKDTIKEARIVLDEM